MKFITGFIRNRIDIVVPIALFLFSCLIYGATPLPTLFGRDGGVYVYQAQQMFEGIPPYVSIFNGKTPVGTFFILPGIWIARLIGWNDLFGVQIVFIGIASLIVVSIYYFSKALVNSRYCALFTSVSFLGALGFSQSVYLVRPKVVMLLFLILFLIFASRRRWVLAGCAASMAFLSWQPAVIFVLSGGIAVLDCNFQKTIKNLTRYAFGIALPIFLIGIIFFQMNAFKELIECTVIYPLVYHYASAGMMFDLGFLEVIRKSYAFSWVGVYSGLMATVLVSLRSIWKTRFKQFDPYLLILVSLVILTLWSCWDFQSHPDFIPFLPYAAFGFGYILWQASLRSGKPILILFLIICFICSATSHMANGRRVRHESFEEQLSELRYLADNHAPSKRILAINSPQAMAMLTAKNLTRHCIFTPRHRNYIEKNYAGGYSGLLSDIEQQDPELVLFHRGSVPTFMQKWFNDRYEFLKTKTLYKAAIKRDSQL